MTMRSETADKLQRVQWLISQGETFSRACSRAHIAEKTAREYGLSANTIEPNSVELPIEDIVDLTIRIDSESVYVAYCRLENVDCNWAIEGTVGTTQEELSKAYAEHLIAAHDYTAAGITHTSDADDTEPSFDPLFSISDAVPTEYYESASDMAIAFAEDAQHDDSPVSLLQCNALGVSLSASAQEWNWFMDRMEHWLDTQGYVYIEKALGSVYDFADQEYAVLDTEYHVYQDIDADLKTAAWLIADNDESHEKIKRAITDTPIFKKCIRTISHAIRNTVADEAHLRKTAMSSGIRP